MGAALLGTGEWGQGLVRLGRGGRMVWLKLGFERCVDWIEAAGLFTGRR